MNKHRDRVQDRIGPHELIISCQGSQQRSNHFLENVARWFDESSTLPIDLDSVESVCDAFSRPSIFVIMLYGTVVAVLLLSNRKMA